MISFQGHLMTNYGQISKNQNHSFLDLAFNHNLNTISHTPSDGKCKKKSTNRYKKQRMVDAPGHFQVPLPALAKHASEMIDVRLTAPWIPRNLPDNFPVF